MIKHEIEDFTVNQCPICGKTHLVKIDVYRDILPNDMNKDIRVPMMKQVNLQVVCPIEQTLFPMDIMFQEDIYSKVVKLRKYQG